MGIKEMTNSMLEKVKALLEEKKPALTTHRCCIYLKSNTVQLVHLNKREDAIELVYVKSFDLQSIDALPNVLADVVKQNNLDEVPIYWLLKPEDYQLAIIDSLPVPENEIRAALPFRVSSLISFPVAEAAIDYFLMPAKKSDPEHPLIGAVIARKELLEKMMGLLEKIALPLQVIDTPELALKNLTCLYETDQKSTAFIYFFETDMIINITQQKNIYFTRQIKINQTELNDSKFENISLEILRYFDYFQSQWRNPSPTRIYVASDRHDDATIATLLSKHLLTQVDVLSLAPVVEDEETKTALEKDYLLAFGCALREGEQYAPARN